MDRILETHRFGPHRVDVIDQADDESQRYLVIVDGVVITDPPLETAPTPEDIVRLYARSQGQA